MVLQIQFLIQFTTRLLRLVSQHRPLPHSTSTFHFQEDLCGASIFDFTVRSKVPERRSGLKKTTAICSSPWSHSPTLSSLHDVIGSMLGVLLQSLLQFPAVLADFYLSGLLEEGKIGPDFESDDDELQSFSFPQVQVRVSPAVSQWCGTVRLDQELRALPPTPPPPPLTWRNRVCLYEKGAAS